MREMKDSGVAWIGEIPEEWEISLINTLYTVRNTKVSDVDYQPLSVTMKGIVPQLSTAAKTNAHDDRKLVKKGDFAINSRSDRRGSCGISDYDGSVSLINTVLSPRNEMNPIYYSWLFHSSEFADEFYRWGHGIVDDLWTTRWQEMRNISIPVPPLSIQHQIAAYLDQKCTQIDALIANQQKQIEKLKAYKQSVITETVTKGLDPDVQMKDSGVEWIGEIPEHWNSIQLKYIISLIESGVSVNAGAESSKENQFGVLKTSSVSKQVFIPTENKNVNEEEYSRVKCPVTHNTLIVSRMNTPDLVGACGYVDKDYPNLFLPDRLWQVHIKNMYVKYVWYYLISHNIRNYYASLASGTSSSMQNISQGQFESLIISVPSLDEQQAIADYLDHKCSQIDKLIALKQQKIEKLQQYKKSMIYEYVTGKKEV